MAKKVNTIQLNGEPQESLYYYYHNWTAGQKNMIHKGHCNECKFGFLRRGKQVRGEDGVWVGPFETLALVKNYVTKKLLLPPPELHQCCE